MNQLRQLLERNLCCIMGHQMVVDQMHPPRLARLIGLLVGFVGNRQLLFRPRQQLKNPKQTDYFLKKLDNYEWYIDVGLRIFAEKYNAYVTQPNLVTQFPSYSDLRELEVDDF